MTILRIFSMAGQSSRPCLPWMTIFHSMEMRKVAWDNLAVIGKKAIWRCLLLRFHELTYKRPNLICLGIKHKVSCVEYVDLTFGTSLR
jgi:hypothetical protein